jgi:hypothetical protein
MNGLCIHDPNMHAPSKKAKCRKQKLIELREEIDLQKTSLDN